MVSSLEPQELIMENGIEEDDDEQGFSDPEDFEEEIDDEELVGDILKDRPRESEVAECCIIIDGIPKVGAERLPKLKNVLQKIFKRFSDNFKDHYPLDENEESKGYCFVEYPSKTCASEAAAVLHGYKLDKNHMFQVNLFSDIEKYQKPDEKWTAPEPRPYKDYGNLWWWLERPGCVDQFALQDDGGERIGVFWNSIGEPTLVNDKAQKPRWTETVVKWSPYGTYLTTFHAQGIALWGGENFDQIARFAHQKVLMIDFSSCETYLVSYAKAERQWHETPDGLRIWDVRTGETMRTFPVGSDITINSWPHFKWSPDEKYFACIKEPGVLSVYETPSFGLVDKKSIKVDGLRDFYWSPKDNILAYWVGEQGQTPARVVVMRFPISKQDTRMKNLFNVADATLYWQPSGDHLGVKIERYGKRKEGQGEDGVHYSNVSHHLEVFRLREKDVPVDTLELKEPVLSFGWEATGHKFCVLIGSHLKSTPVFYSVETGITLLKTLDTFQGLSQVVYSPAGTWVVLAGLKGSTASAGCTGNLVFVDTSGEIQKVQQSEHSGCQEAAWDPTGRYLATVFGLFYAGARSGTDTSYRIWNFQGRELTRKVGEKLCQFHWRPRPPTLLTEKDTKEIKKKMKSYSQQFEEQDKREKVTASAEVVDKRRKLKAEFDEWRKGRLGIFDKERQERVKLRGYDTEVEALEMDEETIEIPESTKETIEKPGNPDRE